MIYKLAKEPFLSLDSYIDVNTFLSFKSKIAYLYATNSEKSISSWVAGGYNTGKEWAHFSGNKKSLYHTYHEDIPNESKEVQDHVKRLELDSPYNKGNELATYFGIMYGTTPIQRQAKHQKGEVAGICAGCCANCIFA